MGAKPYKQAGLKLRSQTPNTGCNSNTSSTYNFILKNQIKVIFFQEKKALLSIIQSYKKIKVFFEAKKLKL